MTHPFPSYVSSGTVRGKQDVLSVDTAADVDFDPDAAYPVGATLTFVPSVGYLTFHPDDAPPDGATEYLSTINAVVDGSGNPTTPTGDVLKLVANIDQPFNDQDWFWQVTVKIGATKYAPFRFDVEAGQQNYLSNQQPIPAAAFGSDIARGPAGADGPAGPGVPPGGSTGYALTKLSPADDDTVWAPGVPSPDARLEDFDAASFRVAHPWYQSDESKDIFVVDGTDPDNPKLANPGIVPPEATTFSASADEAELSFSDEQKHRFLRYGPDGILRLYERRRLIRPGDSMTGFNTVRAQDFNITAATANQNPVLNIGIGGALQQWLDAAYGARPASVTVNDGRGGIAPNTGTIASTGSVSITITPQAGATTDPIWVMIAGVGGVFTPTQNAGSPDPLSASDPGTIAFNYVTGTFARDDQGGATVRVPDGTPMQIIGDRSSGVLYRRNWWVIQPSRHNQRRRYQKVTAAGSAGSMVLSSGATATGSIAWTPTAPTPIAVTFATNDQVTYATAHGLSIGDPVQFGTVTGGAPITAGSIYFVNAVVSSTIVTLTSAQGGVGTTVDITATGSSTTATTATAVFASKLFAQLVTPYTFSGTVNVLSGLPGQTATIGQVEIDWGSGDTAVPLAIKTLTTMTATVGHLRNGIEDMILGIHAQLDMLTSDAREHSMVLDLGPFPGEEDGTTFRKQLDAANAALADCFPREFYPVWSLMRNPDVITRCGGTVVAGDTTAINSTRMTPPTLLDQGGGATNGGHPGLLGGLALDLLIGDRFAAMPYKWNEAA